MVTARAAGATQITASSEGVIGAAPLSVTTTTPVAVATVSVSPASSSLGVGGTVQLSATTRDASNNVLTGRVVTWSSANPGIASVNSSSGLVTAVAAGSATITATSETKTGTAAITVTASTGGPLWRGHEPAGMTTISDQPFATMPSLGWTMFGGAVLQADNSGPQSPGSAMVVPWLAGTAGGNGVGQAYNVLSGTVHTLYFAVWVKFSSNWQGAQDLANKIGYFFVSGSNRFVFEAYAAGTDPLRVNISLQNTANLGGSSNTVSSAAFRRGQWDLLEIVAKTNSANTADGQVDMYLNGVLAVSRPGIMWTSGASNWEQVTLDPIWSWPTETVANSMDIRFDHVYVSGN
jgi:hypothetical protein